jgi:hypothetical protein
MPVLRTQAVSDAFIWVPNGIGGSMSVFLLSLTVLYPRGGGADSRRSGGGGAPGAELAAPLTTDS